MGDSVILRLTEWAEGLYRAATLAKMIIETSMSSQNLSGRSKVSLIHPDQILRELVPPQNVKHLRRVQHGMYDSIQRTLVFLLSAA